jgi:hypothetical protein
MNSEVTKGFTSRLEGAVWALLLTGFAYALAFAYECGYLTFFGIPAEFAEVDLRLALICAGISLVGLFVLAWIVGMLLSFKPEQVSARLNRDLTVLVLYPVAIATFLYLIDAPLYLSTVIVAAMGGLLFLRILITPIFEYRAVKGYLARLEKAAEARETAVKELGPGTLWKYTDSKSLAMILCLIGGPLLAYIIGHHMASHQIVFLMPRNEADCVIVSSGSGGLLCANIVSQSDPANPASRPVRKVQCEYAFLKTEGSVLRRAIVGPLLGAEQVPPNGANAFKLWFTKFDVKSFRQSLRGMAPDACVSDATAPSAGSGSPLVPRD